MSTTSARPEPSSGPTQRDIYVSEEGQSVPPSDIVQSGEPTRIATWRPIPEKTNIVPDPAPSAEEQQQIEELKAFVENELQLPESDSYHRWEKRFLDESSTYPRYMRASKWTMKEAKQRIRGTLEWRREFKPDLISPEEIAVETEGGKIVVNGFDTSGRPIVWLRPSRENTKPSPRQIRHLVFQLERAIDVMPEGVTKLALVVDYKGATKGTTPSLDTCRQVINILQNHYVERLGRAVVINVPFLLQGFFATVKPLLDPTTKSKIKFNPTMSDLVPEQQLDAEFGGDLNYQYDSKVYLPALCHFCGVKDDGTRQDVIPKNEKNSRPEEMQRRLTDQRDAADREGDMEKKEQKQRELEAVNEQQETQQPEPSSSNGTAGVAAAAGGAAAAGAAGAAIASQGKKEQQDQKRTQASKPRGGIKLFSRSRGLDKSGTPTIHHHKHVIKSLCMHKGSVEPGSEAAKRQSEVEKTRSAAGDGAEQNGHSAPPVAAAQEVEPASAQRREERVASATPQEPIQSERPHPTQVHSMSQPDQAEAIATPAKLQNRLHSGQSDDLTLAFKVKKAPEGEMLD